MHARATYGIVSSTNKVSAFDHQYPSGRIHFLMWIAVLFVCHNPLKAQMMTTKLPPKTEFKTFPFEVKSIDEDQGIVTGYLSTFNNVDEQKDRVLPHAFRKTIAEAKSRVQNGRRFLYPALWMHSPDDPIGGVIDAKEDEHGLLVTMQLDITTNAQGYPNNQKATMVFSGFKSGYIDELSMGYNAIQKEYEGGIRNLKECRLVESSAVTMLFAANPDALVPASGVKAMNIKTASGKTTWPLADRNTKWDAGEATKDIEAWADGDWSKVAQCFFWVAKNPPEKLEDCKLPFVAKVGDEMQAIPQGIISGAAVIQGSMGGVDLGGDEDAVKKKIATYYKKLDMTPPWKDDGEGKGNTMKLQRKDFNDLLQAAKAADCLEDWGDLINTLTQAMLQIFGMGDQPQQDMQACLEQFGTAVNAWLEDAVTADLAEYISSRGYCGDNSPYVPYSLRVGDDSYGWMSRREKPAQKAGRTISAATQQTLEQHQEEMKAALSAVDNHVKSMQQKVSDLTNLWHEEGLGDPYTNDKDDTGKSRVMRREPPPALTRKEQPPQSTADQDLTIDDLAALLA